MVKSFQMGFSYTVSWFSVMSAVMVHTIPLLVGEEHRLSVFLVVVCLFQSIYMYPNHWLASLSTQ